MAFGRLSSRTPTCARMPARVPAMHTYVSPITSAKASRATQAKRPVQLRVSSGTSSDSVANTRGNWLAALAEESLRSKTKRRSDPVISTQFTGFFATPLRDNLISELALAYNKPGEYSAPSTPSLFPTDVLPLSTFDINLYVTLPSRKGNARAAHLPVVFIFNCYAVSLQKCEWYTDYAARLASWGYCVIQFDARDATRYVNDEKTRTIVAAVLKWAKSQFGETTLDEKKVAFVGHSKGGSDALMMLASQKKDVKSTAFVLDGVDMLNVASLAIAGVQVPDRKVAFVKADVKSWFDFSGFVDNMVRSTKSNKRCTGVTVTAKDVAHFGFVTPKEVPIIRASLGLVGKVWNLVTSRPGGSKVAWPLQVDTCRPYKVNLINELLSEDRPGIFDVSAGFMVGWLEYIFRMDPSDPAYADFESLCKDSKANGSLWSIQKM